MYLREQWRGDCISGLGLDETPAAVLLPWFLRPELGGQGTGDDWDQIFLPPFQTLSELV